MADEANEAGQDVDLENNDTDTGVDTVDTTDTGDTDVELAELRAFKAEQLKKEAIAKRLAKKQVTPTTKSNSITPELQKDIEEIKHSNKVSSFAEEHKLTKAQADRVLKLYPNADAETLKDPFVAEGLKALVRKERIQNAMPGAGKVTSLNGKTFKEMDRNERIANFSKMVPQD